MLKKALYHTMMSLLTILLAVNMAGAQSYQIYNNDTINKVDLNNMKQDHWIYFGNMVDNPDFAPDQKVEEGDFKDNKKVGLWKKYFPSNAVQSEISFANNRPNGPYKTYYLNGQVEEEGTWVNNRQTGLFKRYYENGVIQQEFNFNATGKREGNQKYYHENGKVMIEGNWNGGKEAGEVKEYYANGDVKSVKVFNEGAMDAGASKEFEPKTPIKEEPAIATPKDAIAAPKVTPNEKPNVGVFDGNGEHTLYNKSRQVSQTGTFKGGKLWEGKRYKYDENGILTNIEIFKNGKYVGEAPLE